MKCKLDENLGAATHRRLADAGHDVSTVVLQRMAGAPDSAVFERCATEGRVLVTCDLDFANPFVFDPRPTAGVVVLRLPKAMTKQHQAVTDTQRCGQYGEGIRPTTGSLAAFHATRPPSSWATSV